MAEALQLVVALYVSTVAHELGHYGFGKAGGYIPTSVGMGTGRPFMAFSVRGCRFYFCWKQPFQGLTFTIHPDIFPSARATVMMTAGGILVNLGVALLCVLLVLLFPSIGPVCSRVGWINLLLAVVSAIPGSIRAESGTLQSDGAQILALLRHPLHEAPASARVRGFLTWRAHWEAIGDRTSLYWNFLSGALAWCELGNPVRGEQWLREAEALPIDRPPYVQAYSACMHGAFLLATGAWQEAHAAVDQALQQFEASGCKVGGLLARLLVAELRLTDGEAAEAAAILDQIAVDPLLKQRPALSAALLSARVRAHLQSNSPQAEDLVAEWESLRKRSCSPSQDSQVLYSLAQTYTGQGRFEAAAAAYDQLVAALRASYHTMLDMPGAEQFGPRHRQVLLDAEAAFTAAGRPATQPLLDTLFPLPEEVQRLAAEARMAQSTRRLQIGFISALANFFFGSLGIAVLMGAHNQGGLRPAEQGGVSFGLISLVALLAFFGTVGVIYGLCHQLVARWFPGARTDAGTGTILIAVLPWVLWGLFNLLAQRF